MATSYTAAQIAEFEQTLVERKGVLTASFSDQQVQFTSYEDAMKFLAEMRRQVAAAAGTPTTRYAATSKGV
jgi:hypothetical protein